MEKMHPIIQLYTLISNEINEKEDYILGQILTIIDASIQDPQQRKGIKDLIKRIVHDYDRKDWFKFRILQMIKEFNQKFSKLALTKEENEFLLTGEWTIPNNKNTEQIPDSLYFN